MISFFVLINGFEARVRAQMGMQSLTCASKQLGNVTVLQPLAVPAARDWSFSFFFGFLAKSFFGFLRFSPVRGSAAGLPDDFLKAVQKR